MKLNRSNFYNTIKKIQTFENNPYFGVAVSGGPDSMCLLNLLHGYCKLINGNLIAIIVNHNLRSEASKEALLVSNLLNKKNIKTKILNVKSGYVMKKNMKEARDNRYRLLTNFFRKNNIIHLFVGHHYDDNIETFVNRKIAGSDFDGLQAMDYITIRDKICIIRPLLDFTKTQILQYNKENNVIFIEDPSNVNNRYTRPIIRNFLKEIDSQTRNEINNDFRVIKQNSYNYNLMLSDTLIDNITYVNKNYIDIDYYKFFKLNSLLIEKVIKRIYHFFYGNNSFLRTKKVQLLIEQAKKNNFKQFNLKGMNVKKDSNSLIFEKILLFNN